MCRIYVASETFGLVFLEIFYYKPVTEITFSSPMFKDMILPVNLKDLNRDSEFSGHHLNWDDWFQIQVMDTDQIKQGWVVGQSC